MCLPPPPRLNRVKTTLFQTQWWTYDFPTKKNAGAQKHCANSCREKMAFSTPVGMPWDPPPLSQSLYGRTDVRLRHHQNFVHQWVTKFFLSVVLRGALRARMFMISRHPPFEISLSSPKHLKTVIFHSRVLKQHLKVLKWLEILKF